MKQTIPSSQIPRAYLKCMTSRAKEIDPKGEAKVKMNVNNFARVTLICYSLQQLYESKNVYKRN